MNSYLALLLGLAAAGLGGELFVRGTVGLAAAARVAPGIIAATVAAFATSSPELTVAITSALQGTPGIALGDALGSNIVNVALILGITALIAPIRVPPSGIRRDVALAIVAPLALGVMLIDGALTRLDGALLLVAFLVWLFAILSEVRRQRSAVADVLGERKLGRAVIESIAGLAFLIAAGRLIVHGAVAIAADFGLSAFVVGSTVVAIGTSVPELATAVMSRLRGHDEVGLGTILGSNIFNGCSSSASRQASL